MNSLFKSASLRIALINKCWNRRNQNHSFPSFDRSRNLPNELYYFELMTRCLLFSPYLWVSLDNIVCRFHVTGQPAIVFDEIKCQVSASFSLRTRIEYQPRQNGPQLNVRIETGSKIATVVRWNEGLTCHDSCIHAYILSFSSCMKFVSWAPYTWCMQFHLPITIG